MPQNEKYVFLREGFDGQEMYSSSITHAYILDYHPAELDIIGIPSSVYRKLNWIFTIIVFNCNLKLITLQFRLTI